MNRFAFICNYAQRQPVQMDGTEAAFINDYGQVSVHLSSDKTSRSKYSSTTDEGFLKTTTVMQMSED